jgi:hypothetical protein
MLAFVDPPREIVAGLARQARRGDSTQIKSQRLRPGAQRAQKSRLA